MGLPESVGSRRGEPGLSATMARPARDSSRSSVRGRWPLAVLLALSLVVFVPAVTHDLRDNVPYGDQTSHMYLALSAAYDSHTLNFDRRDSVRWAELNWTPQPFVLFFQRYDGGWAASKPYGYPIYLAPFVAALGPVTGVAVGNTLLLALLVGGSLLLALRRLDPLTAALIVAAFYFAGYIYMYAYPVMTELFLAALVLAAYGGAYLFRETARPVWAVMAVIAMAFGVVEKLALLMLFAPLACVILWDLRRRRSVAGLVLAAGLATIAIGIVPYLKYSNGDSFTPYAGARFQTFATAEARTPWDGGQLNVDYHPSGADEGAIARRVVSGKLLDRFESLGYYVVGRHTGLLVTAPFALLLLVALFVRLPASNRWAVAGLLGIVGYIAFYLVLFPKNYFGGGQSLGNRYFVQVAPAVLVTALFAPLGARGLRWLALGGIALSALFNVPHHLHPQTAYIKMLRTSAPQRLLPIEANQDYTWIFRQLPPPHRQ
jgi:hypothetical protein